jgi:glycosyltransferase involved in cell wall biosynthesis
VLFLIRSLNRGGAERQLIDLASALDQKHFEVALATFYDVGELRCELEKIAGVKLYSLHKKGRWDIHWLPRLCALVRAFQPKIIVGYLSTGNWASLLGGKVAGSKVVWAIRGSDNRESGYYTWFDQANFHLARLLSRFADLVIFNSSAGKQYYLQEGYAPSRTIVIPNGIDTDYFVRRVGSALLLRRRWEVPARAPLIGLVARLDPVKDHLTFLRAASLLLQKRPEVYFACVGFGPTSYAHELNSLARDLGIQRRVRWAGSVDDMPAVYSALDINTLCTPRGEGFPNTIAEAMSCGSPCVVTPAGDSACIVGDTGVVVRARCPEELAAAWDGILALTDENKARLRTEARNQILNNFPKELMIRRMEQALLSVGV